MAAFPRTLYFFINFIDDLLTQDVYVSVSVSGGRFLLTFWTTNGHNITSELRNYSHTLLRVLIGSKPADMYLWCVDAILKELSAECRPTMALFKALEEVVHNREYLRIVVLKRPKLHDVPEAQRILSRFLAIPEGFAYLSEQQRSSTDKGQEKPSWLDRNVLLWQEANSKRYANEVEEKLSLALGTGKDENSTILRGLVPIPIQVLEALLSLDDWKSRLNVFCLFLHRHRTS